MITLKELAKRCGVSTATVSNAINGKSNISEATKVRIMQMIKETGYKPNFMARNLRINSKRTIGLIIEELTAFSSAPLIEGIMSFLEEQKYETILYNMRVYSNPNWVSDESFVQYCVSNAASELIAKQVSGIIHVAEHSRKIKCYNKKLIVPVVICYAYPDERKMPHVSIDDETSTSKMAEYILSKGHTKIAMICGSKDNLHAQKRYKSFKRVLSEHNVEFDEEFCVFTNWSKEDGKIAAAKILKKNVTAVFCHNDFLAGGVYDYLYENNIQPGKDLLVTGFDNHLISSYLHPGITTMKLPLLEIGQKSAELMIEMLKSDSQCSCNGVEFPCELIIR
ncbi:MAG: LacI family transcriptional regulator [Treponema sp.]|nr:LacI family transcriptional regulator [Treponema sp.]NLK46936.1 LacI family transcriptional regulator [Treponema sp.]